MQSRRDIVLSISPAEHSAPLPAPGPVSTYFGCNTFSETMMKRMLPQKTFTAFKKWQEEGAVITSAQADEIANAMKEWAVAKGVTAYTHWFQPMTGLTAEKHDSFIQSNGPGQVIERFSGKKLILGEPDASSFPSGGIRATFEARGYTAWDPSSPAFIIEVGDDKTLCIPSIFVSYTGEALDKKLPLLRSDQALSAAAEKLLKLLGNPHARGVFSDCGAEQEYFLIDDRFYRLRTDLQLTGRTLAGASSAKGQQLEDQYFGSIKERMIAYMHDVGVEAYKLGIPLVTRHNEVAPHQYEFAPVFERSNLAADHNQLLMDIMKKTAKRHGLVCLLHEKPFAGINGSGKHLNWSLSDGAGANLLNPGDTPEENLQFLVVVVAVLHAVYHNADLLRASVASAGNEHRLGANEAPPAIVSVYLGEQLTRILDALESGKKKRSSRKNEIDLGIGLLPKLTRDTTDRNRTSPFAYTGNKFEFRALGSALNISTPIAVINAIVAESFDVMADRIARAMKGSDLSSAVSVVLADTIRECRAILFEGNNYADSWVAEAARRGLPNKPSTPEALKAFTAAKNIRLFEKHRVFSSVELSARATIWMELYDKLIDIEARTFLEMVSTEILPAALEYQTMLGTNLTMLRDLSRDDEMMIPVAVVRDRRELFTTFSDDLLQIHRHLGDIDAALEKAANMSLEKRAGFFYGELLPLMAHAREHVDALEMAMPDHLWVLPKYKEMLFID